MSSSEKSYEDLENELEELKKQMNKPIWQKIQEWRKNTWIDNVVFAVLITMIACHYMCELGFWFFKSCAV